MEAEMTTLAEKLLDMGFEPSSFMVLDKDAKIKGSHQPVLSSETNSEIQKLLRNSKGQQDVPGVIGYNNGFVAISDGDQYILSADGALGRALEKEGFKDRGLGVAGSNHEQFESRADNEAFEMITKYGQKLEAGDTEVRLAERARAKAEIMGADIKESDKLLKELSLARVQSKMAAEEAAGLAAVYGDVKAAYTAYAEKQIAKGKKPEIQIHTYLETMIRDASEGKRSKAKNPTDKKTGFFKGLFSKKDKDEEKQLAELRENLAGLQEKLLRNPALIKECLQAMPGEKASAAAYLAETLKTKVADFKAKEQEAERGLAAEQQKNSSLRQKKAALVLSSNRYIDEAKGRISDQMEFLTEDRSSESKRETMSLSHKLSFLSGRVQDDTLKQQGRGGNVRVHQGASPALGVNMAKGGR